jgi:hypothetical protein
MKSIINCHLKTQQRRRRYPLKLNIIGIIGAIIAFISLALPWWTMSISSSMVGISYTGDVSIYPYEARVSAMGFSMAVDLTLWYGYVAFALVVLGGLLGIVGSVAQKGRMMLLGGGALALLSIIVFVAGLQLDLSRALMSGWPVVGLFGSGTYSPTEGLAMNYTAYLSFGFWIALVAGIMMLVASLSKKPVQAAPPPPPQPPI